MTQPAWPVDQCGCGEPLHYNSPVAEAYAKRVVADHGSLIKVEVPESGRWWVPRHYIALHGIKGAEVPELAQRFGWPAVAA